MEITTPKIFPLPPVMATPPSTTAVIISSSQPLAIFGRVLPIREVSRIEANPEQRPVTVKIIRRILFTGIPEKRAVVGLFPITNTFRHIAV